MYTQLVASGFHQETLWAEPPLLKCWECSFLELWGPEQLIKFFNTLLGTFSSEEEGV